MYKAHGTAQPGQGATLQMKRFCVRQGEWRTILRGGGGGGGGVKNHEAKFNGDLNECWSEYVDSCSQIGKNCCLSSEEKLQYLHTFLSEDALRFHFDTVQPQVVTYQQDVDLIDREHNFAVRKARVKIQLNGLRVSAMVSKGTKKLVARSTVVSVRH